MAHQMTRLSWANYVAVRFLHLSNQARIVCGWSEKQILAKTIITISIRSLYSFQISLWQFDKWKRVPIRVQYPGAVHSLWRKLLKWKWNPVITLIPKSISGTGRLCLPHLSAKWNLYQRLLPHNGYRLPRNVLTIRLYWAERWQHWGISTDGEILWKWQQCPCFYADHSKPLESQVKDGST